MPKRKGLQERSASSLNVPQTLRSPPSKKRLSWQAYRPVRLEEFEFSNRRKMRVAYLPPSYKEVSYLSSGTFGVVLRATTADGISVVVKLIECNCCVTCESALRELHNYAFFTTVSPHPAIVKLLDCWFHNETLYLVLPQYPRVLDTLLDECTRNREKEGEAGDESEASPRKRQPCLTPMQRKGIATCMLRGIKHLHQFGIVHRDLKPSNVVLTEDLKQAAIIDLGSLRRVADAGTVGLPLTPAKECMTVGYYPPETIINKTGQGYRHEADNFAAGLVLAQLFTGKEIFQNNADATDIDVLKLEKRRRAFVEELLGGYESVTVKEMELVTSLLAAHPAARATAAQALRQLVGQDDGSDSVEQQEEDSPSTPRCVSYSEPQYSPDDLELMNSCIKTRVVAMRRWFKQQHDADQ